MRLRAHLLAASTVAALLLSGAAVAPAGAEPVPPPATGTVEGVVRDVDGGVDLTVGAHPVLYVWQDGAFVPSCPLDAHPGRHPRALRVHRPAAPASTRSGCSTTPAPTSPRRGPARPVSSRPRRPTPGSGRSRRPPPRPRRSPPRPRRSRLSTYRCSGQLSNEGAAPSVTGLRRVGYRLTASPGVWNVPVSTMTFAYQWQRVRLPGHRPRHPRRHRADVPPRRRPRPATASGSG